MLGGGDACTACFTPVKTCRRLTYCVEQCLGRENTHAMGGNTLTRYSTRRGNKRRQCRKDIPSIRDISTIASARSRVNNNKGTKN